MKRVATMETGAPTRRIFSWVSIRPILYENACSRALNNSQFLGETWARSLRVAGIMAFIAHFQLFGALR